MRDEILEAFPNADLRVSIVWIPMLFADSEAAAEFAASSLTDPRVRQFYDAEKLVGRIVAMSLGHDGTAWDTYLFYDRETVWTDLPPRPLRWLAQAGNQVRVSAWNDPTRFETVGTIRAGELEKHLREAMTRLFA